MISSTYKVRCGCGHSKPDVLIAYNEDQSGWGANRDRRVLPLCQAPNASRTRQKFIFGDLRNLIAVKYTLQTTLKWNTDQIQTVLILRIFDFFRSKKILGFFRPKIENPNFSKINIFDFWSIFFFENFLGRKFFELEKKNRS